MRTVSSFVRTLTTAGTVLLLWAAGAVPALAAPARAAGPLCDPQTTTIRKLVRHAKAFGGPLKQPAPLQFGLTDPTSRLRRGTRVTVENDDAVIQNDAPARLDEDGRPNPSLHEVGVVPRVAGARPISVRFSPRSPRGPPPPA
jgi:hypothetical protein